MPVITIESTKLSKEQKAELVQEMTEIAARVMNLPEAKNIGECSPGEELSLGDLTVRVPTLSEQKRILLLFGREKDVRRAALLGR